MYAFSNASKAFGHVSKSFNHVLKAFNHVSKPFDHVSKMFSHTFNKHSMKGLCVVNGMFTIVNLQSILSTCRVPIPIIAHLSFENIVTYIYEVQFL